jgi:hypothetical protein
MWTELRLLWKLQGVYNHAKGNTPMGKALLLSRTFWFNILAGGLQVADWAGGLGYIAQPYGAAITAIGNVILRLLTSNPITSVFPKVAEPASP